MPVKGINELVGVDNLWHYMCMDIIQTALREYGTLSDVDGKVNPKVLSYFSRIGQIYQTGFDAVWCAAFAGYVLETCGIASTKALNARSYLDWGEKVISPQMGDVVVFWRDTPTSANGHVSFFVKQDGIYVYCLGGNQGIGIVDIERYPLSRVLGFRRAVPKPVDNPKIAVAVPVLTPTEPVDLTQPKPVTPSRKSVLDWFLGLYNGNKRS